jgi:KDO2-lipid IV(A) lauroyltransferase
MHPDHESRDGVAAVASGVEARGLGTTRPNAGSRPRGPLALLLAMAARVPLAVLRGVGDLAGDLLFVAHTRLARTTRRNLALCFPHLDARSQRRLARASLRETARLGFEMAAAWGGARWLGQRVVSGPGADALAAAVAAGRRVVVLVPHLGNWEVLNGWLLRSLGSVTAMYEPSGRAWLDDMILAAREREGSRLVPTTHAGVRTLHATLRAGRPVVLLPDQVPDAAGGIPAPFFGREVWTPTLPVRLAQRLRAVVFGVSALRCPGGFVVNVVGPLDFGKDDVANGAATMNRLIEQLIALAPAQYQWEYKRFRYRPRGQLDYYK